MKLLLVIGNLKFPLAILFGIAISSSALAKKADKVDICHFDKDSGLFEQISVSGNAVDKHMAKHGDADTGVFYTDADGDGFGSMAADTVSCPNPGYASIAADCDDSDVDANPGLPEACDDGIDNNCDGQVDEGCGCDAGDWIAIGNRQFTLTSPEYTVDSPTAEQFDCALKSLDLEYGDFLHISTKGFNWVRIDGVNTKTPEERMYCTGDDAAIDLVNGNPEAGYVNYPFDAGLTPNWVSYDGAPWVELHSLSFFNATYPDFTMNHYSKYGTHQALQFNFTFNSAANYPYHIGTKQNPWFERTITFTAADTRLGACGF